MTVASARTSAQDPALVARTVQCFKLNPCSVGALFTEPTAPPDRFPNCMWESLVYNFKVGLSKGEGAPLQMQKQKLEEQGCAAKGMCWQNQVNCMCHFYSLLWQTEWPRPAGHSASWSPPVCAPPAELSVCRPAAFYGATLSHNVIIGPNDGMSWRQILCYISLGKQLRAEGWQLKARSCSCSIKRGKRKTESELLQ